MVERLMLLISSEDAGNVSTEINNEIVDMFDHLRSNGSLTTDEYEFLRQDLIQ
ncbi:hypothetical protein ACJMK2_020658 [Sinanodonta woodiana]|uniref:SHOCT domain-containing protein n=1 Tax=Sinanodonta woodiana TaxID=1069815 RepID=A0ABD3U2D6_SINWO